VRQLRVGGYLFTGHSETLNAMDIPVKVVGPTMYRKVEWWCGRAGSSDRATGRSARSHAA
jgi:hypothetical protein